MKAFRYIRMVALVVCLILNSFGPGPALAEPVENTSYVLDEGDSLNVSVVEQPDLNMQNIRIRPDGKISLPLLGEIQASGLTVAQLMAFLTQVYERYVRSPHVVVNVELFRTLRVSVIGQVKNSGTFEFRKPPTVLDAIAMAGGFTERADRGRVTIYSQAPAGNIRVVDFTQTTRSGQIAEIVLNQGDMIEVGEVWYPDFYRVVPFIAATLGIVATIIALTRR